MGLSIVASAAAGNSHLWLCQGHISSIHFISEIFKWVSSIAKTESNCLEIMSRSCFNYLNVPGSS